MSGSPLVLAVLGGCAAIASMWRYWPQLTAHVRTWHAQRSADPIVRRRQGLDALDRIHHRRTQP